MFGLKEGRRRLSELSSILLSFSLTFSLKLTTILHLYRDCIGKERYVSSSIPFHHAPLLLALQLPSQAFPSPSFSQAHLSFLPSLLSPSRLFRSTQIFAISEPFIIYPAGTTSTFNSLNDSPLETTEGQTKTTKLTSRAPSLPLPSQT